MKDIQDFTNLTNGMLGPGIGSQINNNMKKGNSAIEKEIASFFNKVPGTP